MLSIIVSVAVTLLVVFLCGVIFFYFIAPRIVGFRLARRRLGKVFASYSHEDEAKVKLIGQVAKGLGGEFVSDRTHILGGEDWRETLKRLIRESDTFQLFWSSNASSSPEVKNEWAYALELERKNFICPIYWEKGLAFPPELSHLQFVFIDLDEKKQRAVIGSVPPAMKNLKAVPVSVLMLFILTVTALAAGTYLGVRRVTVALDNSTVQPSQEGPSSPVPTPTPATPTPSPVPAISISSTAIEFADSNVGVPAATPQTITIRNTGNTQAEIKTVEVEGKNPGDFRVVRNECTSTPILPGSTCNILVEFTATAGGDREAEVVVTGNGEPLTAKIRLLGKGIPSAIVANPPALDFGNVGPHTKIRTLTVTVSTSGKSDFHTISRRDFADFIAIVDPANENVKGGATAAFGIREVTCVTKTDPNDPNRVCRDLAITVAFIPRFEGKSTATLRVANTQGGKVEVSMTGVTIR